LTSRIRRFYGHSVKRSTEWFGGVVPGDVQADLTAEVLRNALVLAAEEAGIVVVRSAYSTFIVEGSDASAAILDADGRLVAQSTATTLAHSASLRASLPALLETYALGDMRPGDVFAQNDVYRGGIHANDVIIFVPVFAEGRPAYFTGTLIHVSDIGGAAAGGMASNATEVFHEGVQLPPIRIATADGMVDEFVRVLAANSRTPDDLLGDLRALIAGATVARRRMEDLLDEYGPVGLHDGVEAYMAHSEQLMRQSIAALPDGTFRGEFPIDGDGIGDKAYVVRVAVTVAGDTVRLDFTGTDDQSPGAINAGFSQAMSGAVFALRCFLDPAIPMNEGCLRPIEFVLPRGSLVNPRPPAACGGRFVTVYAAMDAIFLAMAEALPDRAVAASGMITPFTISAARFDRVPWVHMAYDFGGMGGRSGADGRDATGPHFGIGRNTVPQVEPIEVRCPVVVEAIECRPDSGGAGEFRGGLGSRTTFLLREDGQVTVRSDRHRFPPPGARGGASGAPGGYYRVAADGTRTRLPDKTTGVPLRAGDRFVVETSGGGGLGAPAQRPDGMVAKDLADGRISAEGARAYGAGA
jgi:N-methylhydantoinase B